jgi:hypothetical protein
MAATNGRTAVATPACRLKSSKMSAAPTTQS